LRHGEAASRAAVVAEADRSAHPHPCQRGAISTPTGSCATSGFAAGLPATVVEHATPGETGSRLALSRVDLAQQWRGFPPDRPPRS
jgi:hypothetical protein